MDKKISDQVRPDNPFSRLMALKKMGILDDYQQILNKSVIVIGIGGVGSVAAQMLVRCGIRKIKIFDYDFVQLANMNRMFFVPKQVGMTKVNAAIQTLLQINPSLQIEGVNQDITMGKGYSILKTYLQKGVDLLLSCVDNYTARLTINALCAEFGQVWFQSGVSEDALTSHVQLIIPGQTACFACAEPLGAQSVNKKRQGVCSASLPTTMSITAGIMVQNSLKYLLSFGKISQCLGFNSLLDHFHSQPLFPNQNCTLEACRKAQKQQKGILKSIRNKLEKPKLIIQQKNQWGIQLLNSGQLINQQLRINENKSIQQLMGQFKAL